MKIPEHKIGKSFMLGESLKEEMRRFHLPVRRENETRSNRKVGNNKKMFACLKALRIALNPSWLKM